MAAATYRGRGHHADHHLAARGDRAAREGARPRRAATHLIQIVNENVPHIRHVDRVTVNDLGDVADGLVHVSVHVGFTDSQDVPKGLALALGKTPELDVDLDTVHYFLSVLTVHATGPRGLRSWRKRLYVWMHHNAANRTEVFHLPPDRTIVMGAHIEL